LIFIKKGGEIRLWETLATSPAKNGIRCQNLIPGNREMIKINTENNETVTSPPEIQSNAADAYVHAPVTVSGTNRSKNQYRFMPANPLA
jgi:NAD(P)-dependent dehydrogenase (short-subunit alcohol dehydrogenase family)